MNRNKKQKLGVKKSVVSKLVAVRAKDLANGIPTTQLCID